MEKVTTKEITASKMRQRGQLSLFIGVSLLTIMTFLAFVINIGLFVKAKINLQNAVDAAAYSGAAVQARQLSNIAYLNWEMRNTYKEWMFKYYVLGQMSSLNRIGQGITNGPVSNFKAVPFGSGPTAQKDPYNVPTICIHNGTSTNICGIFKLPGLPRFEVMPIAGLSDIHESVVNTFVQNKSADCAKRTELNFANALIWTYGFGLNQVLLGNQANIIAGERKGAWVESLELAMRMRNLEMIVNRPPIEKITQQDMSNLQQQFADIGYNERPIKAFMSAYRNLSGGEYKEKNMDELATNFVLTEVAPAKNVGNASGYLSTMLIPQNKAIGGVSATEKPYLDLQAVPINYALMYTQFAPQDGSLADLNLGNTVTQGACGTSRTALPVPGYVFGFMKNPKVMTYYTVKGESKFIGMFFPFNKQEGIKLTAYSTAKPFGGRIGPRLFETDSSNDMIQARNDNDSPRSALYASYLEMPSHDPNQFQSGDPVPTAADFWATDAGVAIGGKPTNRALYVIPNMIYDYQGSASSTNSGDKLNRLKYDFSGGAVDPAFPGLFDKNQWAVLRNRLNSAGAINPGVSVDGQAVAKSIEQARSPTLYDLLNYLVPDPHNAAEMFSNPATASAALPPKPDTGHIVYRLFAPLVGEGLLWSSAGEIKSTIFNYLHDNEPAILTYDQALKKVADNIRGRSTNSGSVVADYSSAADSIHNGLDLSASGCTPNKMSLAAKFKHFFLGGGPVCGFDNLTDLYSAYVEKLVSEDGGARLQFYYATYVPMAGSPDRIMTAYYPTRAFNVAPDGTVSHPLGVSTSADSYRALRNKYSVKFIATSAVYPQTTISIAPKNVYSADLLHGPYAEKNNGATEFIKSLGDIYSSGNTLDVSGADPLSEFKGKIYY